MTLISQRVGSTKWQYDSWLVNSGNFSFPDPESVHIEHRSGYIAQNGNTIAETRQVYIVLSDKLMANDGAYTLMYMCVVA